MKPTTDVMPNTSDDPAGNLAVFLTLNVSSCLAYWSGRVPAKDQRALFGQCLGRGRLHIDCNHESLVHSVKVCFGADWHDTATLAWRELSIPSQ